MTGNGDKPKDRVFAIRDVPFDDVSREKPRSMKRSNPTSNLTLHRGGLSSAHRARTRALEAEDLETQEDPGTSQVNAESEGSRDILAYVHGKPLSWEEIERLAVEERAASFDGRNLKSGKARRGFRYRTAAASIVAAAVVSYGVVGMRTHAHSALAKASHDLNQRSAESVKLTRQEALRSTNDADAISVFVVMPPDDIKQVAYNDVEPAVLEDDVKNELRMHAFPDIGVSAGARGEVFLAGDVYSLDEVSKIKRVARQVDGVHRVHFLHPNLRSVTGPAYFGAVATNDPNIWGAKVTNVLPGSPADKAGIHGGDIIREFNNQTIPDGRTLETAMAHCAPGDRVEVRIHRDGADEIVGARLSDRTIVAER